LLIATGVDADADLLLLEISIAYLIKTAAKKSQSFID